MMFSWETLLNAGGPLTNLLSVFLTMVEFNKLKQFFAYILYVLASKYKFCVYTSDFCLFLMHTYYFVAISGLKCLC